MADTLLENIVTDVRRAFEEDQTILSFGEYFSLLTELPTQHLRSSAQYLVDVIDSFGWDELKLPTGNINRPKLFDAAFDDGDGFVAGQHDVINHVYRILQNFAREGRVNKLILLHGPNGSAKSSMVRCLMGGMEEYARQPEGAMYSFNWIFPSDKISKEGIGFGTGVHTKAAAGSSYAYLDPDRIDARVPCDMHDHPIFLIPATQRRQLLQQLVPDASENQFTTPEHLRKGDLCYKCRRIYDALLAGYDGDASKVLNHVQVERFFISRRYRHGAATIEPQVSVDARMQQVTADQTMAALPKSLRHVSLFNPTGPLVDANRGLLEFSDLLKRPVEANKYLLGTIETATVSMDSFVLHLDMVYIASTNESYLDAFKQHPDFTSFKGRMELVQVPYLVRYADEKEIYRPATTIRIVGRHVAPHAIDVAALWAVLTRMRRNDASLYSKDMSKVIDALTPLEKIQLYDLGETPARLTASDAKELLHIAPDLYKESKSYPNYEGRFGASAREIRTALLNAAHHKDFECLSPLALFDEIKLILNSKSVYEFLKQDVLHGFHDHVGFLKQTEQIYGDWVDQEVRESMQLVTAHSHEQLFTRYVSHVTHWVKREKMQDPASGKFVDPDENVMGEVERVLIARGEKKESFRKSIISTIGARSLDKPHQIPNYQDIFKPYIDMLREDYFASRQTELRQICEHFLNFVSGDTSAIDSDTKEQVTAMLDTLKSRYGYCIKCARDTVAYLLKKRYAG